MHSLSIYYITMQESFYMHYFNYQNNPIKYYNYYHFTDKIHEAQRSLSDLW